MAQEAQKLIISDLILKAIVVGLRMMGEVDSILMNPYQYTHGLPFRETVITSTVQRLVRSGRLSKNGRGRNATYRITEKGKQRVREHISKYLIEPEQWDGRWRMVVYDIEESERRVRNKLRRFLKSLGFGMLQQSIWVSPYPVRITLEKFLKESGMSDVVLLVESDYIGGQDHQELASRVWDLNRLHDRYASFSRSCEIAKRVDQSLRREYEWLIVHDPFLPIELASLEDLRGKAFQAYKTLLQK